MVLYVVYAKVCVCTPKCVAYTLYIPAWVRGQIPCLQSIRWDLHDKDLAPNNREKQTSDTITVNEILLFKFLKTSG